MGKKRSFEILPDGEKKEHRTQSMGKVLNMLERDLPRKKAGRASIFQRRTNWSYGL